MSVDLDVAHTDSRAPRSLTYWNNSPDTIRQVFFHLYFNAFRPGSEMDVRSRTIVDPDRRVGGRIAELAPGEIGLNCAWMTHAGRGGLFDSGRI